MKIYIARGVDEESKFKKIQVLYTERIQIWLEDDSKQ